MASTLHFGNMPTAQSLMINVWFSAMLIYFDGGSDSIFVMVLLFLSYSFDCFGASFWRSLDFDVL